MLAGLSGAVVPTAGCLDTTDDCYRWGLSFQDTTIETSTADRWVVSGTLRALFSPSSTIDKPYEAAYTDVAVLVITDGGGVTRHRFGTISIDDGTASGSDCIDTIVREPFSVETAGPPIRITADCAEFSALCDHGDSIREYIYLGDEPDAIDAVDFSEAPWDEWDNRERPCSERELTAD